MNTIETLDPTPFKHLIMTVGELPASYLESMTYYEMLAWICNYVEKNVVPTVNNNAEAIKEIQEWISTLDLQDEVDHKLDEMAESGELAEIIAAYLNTKAIICFDSVSDMASSENLADGSYARTLGFYEKEDNGAAYYTIRTKEENETPDEITVISIGDTLVAELLISEEMTPEQFGAKGDGETDDTASINLALQNCSILKFAEKSYLVDASISIIPQNHSILQLNKATIITKPNALAAYSTINIDNKTDVTIIGGLIVGDNLTHTDPSTGESGHCIAVRNGSSKIILKDIQIKDARGDGITLQTNVSQIDLENVKVSDSRRQGISLIYCNDVNIINCLFEGSIGLDENGSAGIDIEPNNSQYVKNVNICNVITKNNSAAGINLYQHHYASHPDEIKNINISNVESFGNAYGANIAYSEDVNINNFVAHTNEFGINIVNSKNINCNNLSLHSNTDTGLRYNGAILANCNNCLIHDNAQNVQMLNASKCSLTNSKIIDNTDATKHNMYIESSVNCMITNNIFDGSQRSHISFNTSQTTNAAKNNIFTGNKFLSASVVEDATNPCINLVKNATDNIFSNNDFVGGSDNETYVFSAASTCTGNYVKENIMNSKQTGSILGTDLTIKTLNNIIDGVLVPGNLAE